MPARPVVLAVLLGARQQPHMARPGRQAALHDLRDIRSAAGYARVAAVLWRDSGRLCGLVAAPDEAAMSALQAVLVYIKRGWSPIPVAYRGKASVTGWPELRITTATAGKYFDGSPQNIGILTGSASGGLADVDLDCDEAIELASSFLPESNCAFGRPSRRRSHIEFVVDGPFDSLKLVDPDLKDDEATIVELRGNGRQTVFPGSVHESGEPITWDCDGEPARVSAPELTRAVQRIAAAVLLLRRWHEGVHDDLCTAVVGCLIRAGWQDADIENFIAAIVEVAGDPKINKRLEKIERLRHKWDAGDGKGVPGLPSLIGHMGSDAAAKNVARWIGLSATQDFKLTDYGNAERLVAECAADWHYLPEVGWVHFDGVRWADDREGGIMTMAAQTVRRMDREVAEEPDEVIRKARRVWAHKSESRRSLEAMIALAQSHPDTVDLLERYDQQPMLLAVNNGVLDLETGAFRAGRREDRLRLKADVSFDPDATAPRFEQFLSEIFGADAEVIAFIQRAAGYSATGLTIEQVIFMLFGVGKNGKTTLLNALRRVLGDYSKTIQPETLLARDGAGINNDVARLRGARFGPTVEVEEGKRMAESFVKQMSGGDAITARFLRKEYFEFIPSVKIWLASNHKPVIAGSDWAIWRRILLVPFNVTIPPEKCDKQLEAKLIAEAPGILNWIVQGCRAWRSTGLAPPASVVAATDQYRRDMDRVGMFLKERTRIGAGRTKCSAVYKAYAAWCASTNVHSFSRMRFREKAVNEHGLIVGTHDGYEHYVGLLLVLDDASEDRL